MECTTAFDPSRRASRSRGFTLVEVMVAFAIGSLVLLALNMLAAQSSRAFLTLGNHFQLAAESRSALQRISQDARQARSLLEFSTNKIVLDIEGDRVAYQFDPAAKTLERVQAGKAEILLRSCQSAVFTLYSGFDNERPEELEKASGLADCKAIRVTWSCSKTSFRSFQTVSAGESACFAFRDL